jgi:hypothetical protein
VNNHVRHFHIHFLSVGKINTLEIDNPFLELILHLGQLRASSGFYQSKVNLTQVYLMINLAYSHLAQTTFVCFVNVSKLFTVWWGVSDMENVSQDGSSWKLDPIQVFTAMHKTIVNSLGKISTTLSLKLFYVFTGLMTICEIKRLGHI